MRDTAVTETENLLRQAKRTTGTSAGGTDTAADIPAGRLIIPLSPDITRCPQRSTITPTER